MSDKPFDKLNIIDQQIRRTLRLGDQPNGTYLTIEFIHGFELFNTRPYHNYETWSQGYRVTDPTVIDDKGRPLVVEQEDLHAAMAEWMKRRAARMAEVKR
jgi:hypothetical protein